LGKKYDADPSVFLTYKSPWEVFHKDQSAPKPWNTYEKAHYNVCNIKPDFGDVILAPVSKFVDVGQADLLGNLVGPLVAQNGTYVRYLTAFNKTIFNQIRGSKLYLRANTPSKGLTFNDGSLNIKSAWVEMKNMDKDRYYTRRAYVFDYVNNKCMANKIEVGLVGLHIVRKTEKGQQWIWATFEHVDNVPPAEPGASGKFTFNDEKGQAMPSGNPYNDYPLQLPPPQPYNVTRAASTPIHPSTKDTNSQYTTKLKEKGTVWQYYRLVMTQWPIQNSTPSRPGTPRWTFPGAYNYASAFANTTMETFYQENIRTGCMNCHYMTKGDRNENPKDFGTDFVWTVRTHALPDDPKAFFADPALGRLRELLKSSNK